MVSQKGARKSRIASWWTFDGDETELASQIYDTVCYLDEDQQERRDRNLRCLKLYGNSDLAGTGPYTHAKTTVPVLPENRVKYNVISACTDTVCSKISKMKPRVTFLTEGGNWSLQEQSKNLSKWVQGAFFANHIYELHQGMFRNGLVQDIGAIKHFRQGGRIHSEAVLSNEIYVDICDSMYGRPMHLYHVKFVHKDVLSAQWPKKEAAIRMSSSSLSDSAISSLNDEEKNYVIVIEGWRLPSSDDAKDGRHVISVEKGVLLDEPYSKDYFPFTFSRWSSPIIGFYGQSLADRLTGNQIEINKMLRIIQRSFHLGSAFKVFLEYSSKVPKEHINNDIGNIIYYSGVPPQFYTPQTVHPEYFRHLEWLIRSSFEEAGISQLSATSKLPAGLDTGSGKALREYNDLETERFAIVAQLYEASFLETARQYIELARDMAADGENMAVVAESKRFVEKISWKDVKLKDNEYVMQMFPTNLLPQRPEGKLAYVQELINSGMVDQLWGLSLLEFPDTDGYAALKLAPLDSILKAIDTMLYKGKYVPPEPFQDLKLGISLCQSSYLRAQLDGAPDARLELLRRWMATADSMNNMAQSAASAVPQANPVPLGGAQAPVPVQQASPLPGPMGAAPIPAA